MKVSVITARFAVSGVALAQIRFATALANRGHQVSLLVGYVDPEFQFPDVPGVRVIVWHRKKVRSMLVPLTHFLWKENPDIVFSAEDHLNAVVLLAAILSGSKAKVSASSRVTPFDTYSDKPFSKRLLLKYFMRSVMWRADALTCVSEDMVDQYRQVFDSPPHVSIYNIVDDRDSRLRMKQELDHEWFLEKQCPVLVAAGRLAPWKGFVDLIRAMKLVADERQVRLVILGDGPQRSELDSLIQQLNLTGSICLAGYVNNPLKYYAHADVFILSSLVEGLPNVLVEAMMCGCTAVSTDCPTGPREVLQDGKFGYLVPVHDPEAMAAAIQKALDNPTPPALLAEAVSPFEESAVVDRHFEVLGLCQKSSI